MPALVSDPTQSLSTSPALRGRNPVPPDNSSLSIPILKLALGPYRCAFALDPLRTRIACRQCLDPRAVPPPASSPARSHLLSRMPCGRPPADLAVAARSQ